MAYDTTLEEKKIMRDLFFLIRLGCNEMKLLRMRISTICDV